MESTTSTPHLLCSFVTLAGENYLATAAGVTVITATLVSTGASVTCTPSGTTTGIAVSCGVTFTQGTAYRFLVTITPNGGVASTSASFDWTAT